MSRTIALLWRAERPLPRRGGRPARIGVDDVVEAAIAIADADGLVELSFRRVAERLGVGVMTLYGHVESRAQLVELMIDECHRTMSWSAVDGTWRERLTRVLDDNLALYAAHPWLAEIESERAVLGPGTLAKYERELGAVADLPADDVTRDRALALVLAFARSSARAIRAAEVERAAETPADWWAREGAELAALGIDERYPLAARIGRAAGEAAGAASDARAAAAFGLRVLLDGLESIAR